MTRKRREQPPTAVVRRDIPQREALAESLREIGAPSGLANMVEVGRVPASKAITMLALRKLDPTLSWGWLQKVTRRSPDDHPPSAESAPGAPHSPKRGSQ